MKKTEEKRMVLEEWSESDIRWRGFQIAFRKYWIPTMIIVLGILTGISYTCDVSNKIVGDIITGSLLLLSVAISCLFYWKIGNKYWDKIKNIEQPIKLEKLPSALWIFNRK